MAGNALQQSPKVSQHRTPRSVHCVHFDAAADINDSAEIRTVTGQIAAPAPRITRSTDGARQPNQPSRAGILARSVQSAIDSYRGTAVIV